MARDLNQVTLTGRLGADPELRFTATGTATCSFRIAVSKPTKADGSNRGDADWVNIVAWQKLAETCNQYLAKGRRVGVTGRLQTRSWEGQDGQRRYITEVVASDVVFLDQSGAQGSGAAQPPDDDDLPF